MSISRRRASRRAVLRYAGLGGFGLLAAYLVGCGDGAQRQLTPTPAPSTSSMTPPPEATPAPTMPTTSTALRWRLLSPPGPLPPPRRDHSVVTDGQRHFVFGGRAQTVLGDLWSYAASDGTWSEISAADGPPARFGHNSVFDAALGRVLVFGGQAGSIFFNDVWAFDVDTGEWAQLQGGESGPSPRYGAAAALDPSGRFFVSHGFTDAGRFDDTWEFGLEQGAWADVSPEGERPVERCLMRAVWDSGAGRLLMFGGQTTGTPFLGDLWEFGEEGWRELTADPRPSPRNFYAMAFKDGGQVVLFGGNTQDGPVNDLWFFDSASNRWSQQSAESEGPSPRFGHDAAWLQARRSLFVFGGNDGSRDLNDSWELSLPT